MLKEAREELKNGVDAEDGEAEIEDIREDSGMAGKPEKEAAEFEEQISFYKCLALENYEGMVKRWRAGKRGESPLSLFLRGKLL